MFSKCKIKRGQFRLTYSWKKDASRMEVMGKKCPDSGKQFVIDSEAKEGEIYGKGCFHV